MRSGHSLSRTFLREICACGCNKVQERAFYVYSPNSQKILTEVKKEDILPLREISVYRLLFL